MSGECNICGVMGCVELNHLTPSQQAKAMGLKSLSQVSEITGVSFQTLNNWAKDKPDLFRIVLLGVVTDLKRQD